MPISRQTRRRGAGAVAATATFALSAGVLIGAAPAAAVGPAGIIVSAFAQSPDSFTVAPNVLAFRATQDMVESEITVTRQGNTIIVSEAEGGPSLALTSPTDGRITCTASNPSGLSDEIRCAFGGDAAGRGSGVYADFGDAPRAVTFAIGETSQLRSIMVGSAFDDYFQGGPDIDWIAGGGGEDFAFGGPGDDVIVGGEGDDIIYGDGEGDESGNDILVGGPGDDFIEGGPGIDIISGGPGRDEIDAKDDTADAEIDCNDTSSRGEESEAPRFDRGLDRPIDCGTVELPWALTTPTLTPTALIKPTTVLTATPPAWGGSTPMAYSYRWESCVVRGDRLDDCIDRTKGDLDAAGRFDSKTGKAPVYVVAANDRNRSVRFVAIADNSKKVRGGGYEEVASTALRVGVESAVIKDYWLPKKSGNAWKYSAADRIISALTSSSIAARLDVRATGWRKAAVPEAMRKSIKNGQVFSIRVNGKEMKAKDSIEVAEGVRASVEVRYYSSAEDRKTCPASDENLAAIRQQIRGGYVDFQSMIDFLDERKCPWAVTWSKDTGPTRVFTLQDVALEETDDPDRPVQVRITARRPGTFPQLSIAVGAPPRDIVAQSPDHFTLGLAGAFYAFPGTTFTTVWTNLVGDQTRLPTKRARVQLFVNGKLMVKGEQGADFAYNLATAFTEPGLARVVISTLNNDGSVNGQAYVDIPVLDAATAPLGDLVTWDGRCFNRDGSLASCAGRVPNSNAETMRGLIARTGFSSLYTHSAVDGLRIASERFNARFTPLVVNGPVPAASTAARSLPSPRSGCAWWDLPCHLRGATDQVVRAIIRPKPTPQAPAPAPQPYRMKAPVLSAPDQGTLPAVTEGTVATVPGAGQIALDGATELAVGGGSQTSEAGDLIGIDVASLVGLDAASLVGLDAASLVGLDAASSQPNTVAFPLVGLDGAT